jgi:hypothetical protein
MRSKIHEAIATWGDDWSISRQIAPLGDSSYASDFQDAAIMNRLVHQNSRPADIVRRQERRGTIVKGLTPKRRKADTALPRS